MTSTDGLQITQWETSGECTYCGLTHKLNREMFLRLALIEKNDYNSDMYYIKCVGCDFKVYVDQEKAIPVKIAAELKSLRDE